MKGDNTGAPGEVSRRLGRVFRGVPIVWYSTAALFLAGWLIAPASVSSTSINAMLPFAGVLAIAAIGEMLVVQQRGFDLSVPGMMTFAACGVSTFATTHDNNLALAIVAMLIVAVVVGLANGFIVSFLHVTPFVATLAMNAILGGALLAYVGEAPLGVPTSLANFALQKTAGVSNSVWLALAFVLVVGVVVSRTLAGRRYVAAGASYQAARAAGLRVDVLRLAAYVAAAICYSVAGIVLAGYVGTPSLTAGTPYLLPAFAAVVLGGTPFTGGRGRVIGTAVGAVFLSQLNQLVLSLGAPTSTQYVVQAGVIALFAAIQAPGWSESRFVRRLRQRRLRPWRSPPATPEDEGLPAPRSA